MTDLPPLNHRMPITSADHPPLDSLREYHTSAAARTGADIAMQSHVASCPVCQESLRFLSALHERTDALSAPTASIALRDRILASAQRIEPTATAHVSQPARHRRATGWAPFATAIAALLAVVAYSAVHSVPEAVAGTTAGTLSLSTATPRPGESVTVRYTPGATLGRLGTLHLRARVRTATAPEYTALTPVITLATMRKVTDGAYVGRFTLPDSIVYAALAVEDTAATDIDDRDGRTWEMLRATTAGQPTLAALQQRAGDHMGRSWEVIFETARQMVTAYPDSISAWSYLHTTHNWMGLSRDSIVDLHRDRVRAFDERLRQETSPTATAMGEMYWYARWVDSSVAAHWEAALRRRAPTNTFIVQNRMNDILTELGSRHDTVAILAGFEALWRDAPPDRHEQILQYATQLAVDARDTVLLRRWTDRLLATASASSPRLHRGPVTRAVALDFARIPSLRAEALQRLRFELERVRLTRPAIRGLDETQRELTSRQARGIRATMAALGEALSMDGQHRAARDTLYRASLDGWDLAVMRSLRREALVAGDTATAVEMSARLVIDPRTAPERRAEYAAFGAQRRGAEAWATALDTARSLFVLRAFAAMRPRTIVSAIRVLTRDGKTIDLRTAMKGQITVVAFLSRFCGPAVEVLPELQSLAATLQPLGVKTVTVFEERAPSSDLTAFLQKQKLTLPVLLDATQAASGAFNQWGTPYFYVVDAQGRIMSEPTSDTDELRVAVEAVRLAATMQ